jgi:hypothetical protein
VAGEKIFRWGADIEQGDHVSIIHDLVLHFEGIYEGLWMGVRNWIEPANASLIF